MPRATGPRSAPPDLYIGQRFGALMIVEKVQGQRSNNRRWRCSCDCGRIVEFGGYVLDKGLRRSCGCKQADRASYRPRQDKTHGHCRTIVNKATPTYRSWRAMHNRCNPATTISTYRRLYVDLGITVCERWREFDHFLADMGERPDDMTLDRYPDPAGNYEPGNCRWATLSEQNRNKRSTK